MWTPHSVVTRGECSSQGKFLELLSKKLFGIALTTNIKSYHDLQLQIFNIIMHFAQNYSTSIKQKF